MVLSAFAAVHQARVLRDASIDIYGQWVPFSRGMMELESNLTALRGSDAVLRTQSENNDADRTELLRAHNHMAQILEELVTLAALPLGDVQRTALYTLQTNVTRFQRQHDEFNGLVSAAAFDKAAAYYDTVLAEQSVDIASQVSAFMGLSRRWQLNSTEDAIAAYTATFWAIVGCIGAALAASLLLAGWQWRRATRWQRQSSVTVNSLVTAQ
jgi:hypothetical protein